MKRREFLAGSATLVTVSALAPQAFAGGGNVAYSPGVVRDLLANGETVFVDFSASWCSTCQSQARTISALRSENPAYDEAIKFVVVDWDQYGKGALSKDLKIPRRSTLVVLKGDEELGRIVAGTARSDIQNLMDIALQAASV